MGGIKSITVFLILNFLQNVITNSINPFLAINCGSTKPYIDSKDIKYVEDFQYDKNSFSETTSLISKPENFKLIRFTKDTDMCMNYRTANGNFAYFLPINIPGEFIFTFQFCEVNIAESGARVMQIWLGNTIAIDEIDVYQKIGELSTLYLFLYVERTIDNKIYFKTQDNQTRIEAKEAIDKHNNNIVVIFKSVSKEPPFINSILVNKGSLLKSHTLEKEKEVQDWKHRTSKKEQKKFQLYCEQFKEIYWSKRFNQQYHHTYYEPHYIPQNSYYNLTDLLFQPKGMIFTAILLGITLCYIALDSDNQSDLLIGTKSAKDKTYKKDKKNK